MATVTPSAAPSATKQRSRATAGDAASSQPASRWQSPWILGLLAGVLYWAALPPLGLWPLAWVATVPLILLARQQTLAGRRPYLTLWCTGFAFWLATLYWLTLPHPATAIGWLALSFYLAFYWPAFVGLLRVATLRLGISVVVAAPVIWAGLELARGHVMTGFLMGTLAHTQYRVLPMIQISDLGGAYAVSFVLVMVAACVARMLPWAGRRAALWPALPLAAVLIATWCYGSWRLGQDERRPGPTLALIQGAVDTKMKTDREQQYKIFDEYFGLSRAARELDPSVELVVWPETMFRYPLFTFSSDFQPPAGALRTPADIEHESAAALQHAAGIFDTPALIGIDTLYNCDAPDEAHYNSALFISSAGKPLARYDKCHRVLFGEYVPFADWFPALYRLTPLPGGIQAGKAAASFRLGEFRYAPNICFETTVPHLLRHQILELRSRNEEPDVLVNLTNDGWFWGSTELDLHLACGVFRSIEARKPLVVAANTGFSASIDSDGRVLAQGGRRTSEFLIAKPQPDSRRSWYLDHGDIPAGACLIGCIALAAVGLTDRWRGGRKGPAAA